MEALKALVDDSPSVGKVLGVEERVGGEGWHGSMTVIANSLPAKRKRGSSFRQVLTS